MLVGMGKMDQDQWSVFPLRLYLIVPAKKKLPVRYIV